MHESQTSDEPFGTDSASSLFKTAGLFLFIRPCVVNRSSSLLPEASFLGSRSQYAVKPQGLTPPRGMDLSLFS
jgi:hypothetical protein